MRQLLEQWLIKTWYGPGAPFWLLPLTGLFRVLVAARRLAYRRKWIRARDAGVPLIVVGNITVGGTGKTPLVLLIVEMLKARGLAVGIVSRGYASGRNSAPRLVSAQSAATDVGDEPVLLARRAAVPLAVGRDRVAAAQLLLSQGVQVIVSDDGLQHYRMARDLEIVVLDGERGLGNGACLPAGPLREPPSRLDEADLVVVNGATVHGFPGAVSMSLTPGAARSVGSGEVSRNLASFRGKTVHALAGIGNPARFFGMLKREGVRVIEHPLPDHAQIAPSDLAFEDEQDILMTEKDAVKCVDFAGSRAWFVPVTAGLNDAGRERLDALLERAICSKKGD